MACTEPFDLIILDVMMPGLDGYAVCRALRERGKSLPILMLTAKGMVDDRVEGLDSGADDYLVKPFSLRELLARVRALLRRFEKSATLPDQIVMGPATIDFAARALIRNGHAETLSEKELGMLRLLLAQRGKTVSREQFLDVVWGYHAYPAPAPSITSSPRYAVNWKRIQPNPCISSPCAESAICFVRSVPMDGPADSLALHSMLEPDFHYPKSHFSLGS